MNGFDNFNVTSRAVRDRYVNISKKYKVQANKEIRKTGVGGEEMTEFEVLMGEVLGLNEESDTKHEN